jgi:predicted aminopeptidase
VSGKEQAAQSEADCRLVFYVAHEKLSRKEATAFSELLADMIRTMKSRSWTEGDLRNAALDHLAVPRYSECKAREE